MAEDRREVVAPVGARYRPKVGGGVQSAGRKGVAAAQISQLSDETTNSGRLTLGTS